MAPKGIYKKYIKSYQLDFKIHIKIDSKTGFIKVARNPHTIAMLRFCSYRL